MRRSQKSYATGSYQNKMEQRAVGPEPARSAADMDLHNLGSRSAAGRGDNQPVPVLYQG